MTALAWIPACGDHPGGAGPATASAARPAPRPAERQLPADLAACAACHRSIVDSFIDHGMAESLGPLRERPAGAVVDPASGSRYAFHDDASGSRFSATRADGGRREQLVVGRLGAGVLATSFVGTELDADGVPTGHLAFLPVESIAGHGLSLAPFEQASPGTGLGTPITADCLECHTTADPARLPGAAAHLSSGRVWPEGLLGADAFAHLAPLRCDACHGDTTRHLQLQHDSLAAGRPASELGLARLSSLPPTSQRDICSRCHMQGEGRIALDEIAPGGPQPADFLARRPVLVPAAAGDDFRFVSQLQRLQLSACAQRAPDLTCTSCHLPHTSVAAQGTAAFDARCLDCHGERRSCARPADLSVQAASGRAPRSTEGCVDCHMRRSQPFDLPHVTSADHFVRRRIPPPAGGPMVAHDPAAAVLAVFDDGRLAPALATEAGQRWEDGLIALALQRMGRREEARAKFAALGAPGSAAAVTPSAPPDLPPLERVSDVHHVRGLLLEELGDAAGARAAYSDALLVDPHHPQARLNRAGLLLEAGDVGAALADAAELLARFPRAHLPWNLRARAALAAGDLPAAASALAASSQAWPSDAAVWHGLGEVLLDLGHPADAALVLQRAAELEPSRPGLAEDLSRANQH